MPPAGILVAVLLTAVSVVSGGEGKSVVLTLEKVSNKGLELSQLREHDRVRHGRLLLQEGVVDFPLEGNANPYLVGIYYARVQLGTPPKEFYVQIDTGSDALWVSCSSCNGCPTSSGLKIPLKFFDLSSSSTASLITCSDQRCVLGSRSSDVSCSNQNQCGYRFQYGDGSGTSGYYLSDMFYFSSLVGNSQTSNSSVPVVFGCSTSQTGTLTKPDRAVDGIFGFGRAGLSVFSQLSSQGLTPKAFAHCLRGENGGGGIMVIGEVVEPNVVYTPLVPSQPHYNVDLQSISINGQTLPIDPSVFATTNSGGAIIDSGTTLAYLVEGAYNPFVTAITQSVSKTLLPTYADGDQCFMTSSSISDIFPPVSLNFAGGASMTLRPQDYLVQQNSFGSGPMWCIGFQKLTQGVTILGDMVLKDKIVVYDLAGQRIGWANHDCSSSVNVSTSTNTGKREFMNTGEINNNNSALHEPCMLISSVITAFLLHITFFGVSPFL